MADMRQTIWRNLFDFLRFPQHLLSAVQALLQQNAFSRRLFYSLFRRRLSNKSPKKLNIPISSWDSHMHIVGNLGDFPLSKSALYTPSQHCLTDALAMEHAHGIPGNIVLIQPSIYGYDNSCLLDGLSRLKTMKSESKKVEAPKSLFVGQARGVVQIDLTDPPSPKTLKEWHDLGVRGIRVNIKSHDESNVSSSEFQHLLIAYADLIRPLDWVLQLYIPLEMIPVLEEVMLQLDVCVCLDHFGGPAIQIPSTKTPLDPYTLPGFASLMALLKRNRDGRRVYVKLSAPYRLSPAETALGQAMSLEPMAMELLKAADGSQVVYATDWPHTRFEGNVDADEFRDICLEWCDRIDGSGRLAEKLFRENAIALWW